MFENNKFELNLLPFNCCPSLSHGPLSKTHIICLQSLKKKSEMNYVKKLVTLQFTCLQQLDYSGVY